MKKLITATLLFLMVVFFGCDSNPISQVAKKEIAEKQISTITITTNRGTETFEYEKLTYADNQYTFTNCTGSPITIDNHTVSVGGTNKIPFVGQALAKYHTPVEVTNNLVLTDFGNVKPTKAAITVSEAFGVVDNGIVLGEPVEWAQITFNGVEYTLPLYLPTT